MNPRMWRCLLTGVAALAITGVADATPTGYEFHTFQGPGAFLTEATGITNQRVVVGFYFVPSDPPPFPGFVFTLDGGLVPVQVPLPGVIGTALYQANQHGQASASYATEDGFRHSAVYDLLSGTWTYLPDPDPSSIFSVAGGFNDGGQVFGNWSDNPDFLNNHGWVYDQGRYTFFDAPGASPNGIGTLVGSANNRGDSVGTYVDGDGLGHGFIRYGDDGRIVAIDVPGAAATSANGINNLGTIVGSYFDADFRSHGFILENGVFTTFDALGAANTNVYAINDRGDLSGVIWESFDSPDVAFVALRVVPEPSTLISAALGLTALAGYAGWRGRQEGIYFRRR